MPVNARRRRKPANGFLESLIDSIDWLSETTFSIFIFLIFTLAFWLTGLSGAPKQYVSPGEVNELRYDFALALRISIIVSFVMLFIAGFRWGRYTGASPWKTGLLLMSVAVALVVVALLLGG